VVNSTKRLLQLPGRIRLLPGPNPRVRKDLWDACQQHRTVREWKKLGWIEKVDGDLKAHPTTATAEERARAANGDVDSLAEYTVVQIKEMVRGVDEPALLERWLSNETRAGAKVALQDQLDALAGE
jgi:hypothetical protein